MLIIRYCRNELLKVFFMVTSILLLIAVSNKFVSLIAKAAMGEFSPGLLSTIIGLQAPELMVFILPLSLFLSIMLTFGRLYTDNEMGVLFSCGMGWTTLIRACLPVALFVSLIVGAMTLWITPTLNYFKEQLLSEDSPELLLDTIAPGRFHTLQDDKLVFYVAEMSNDRRELGEVFIAEQPTAQPEGEDWGVLTAKKGRIVKDPETWETFIELYDGSRYTGTPGLKDYSVISFETYGRLLEDKSKPEASIYYHRSMPTRMLWSSETASQQAELLWRFSLPVSVLVLMLLAIPLSRVPPRAGRFARLLPGIIVFIVYFNLLSLCKKWVATGVLTMGFGIAWVHGAFILLAIGLLLHASGRGRQVLRWIKYRYFREAKPL